MNTVDTIEIRCTTCGLVGKYAALYPIVFDCMCCTTIIEAPKVEPLVASAKAPG